MLSIDPFIYNNNLLNYINVQENFFNDIDEILEFQIYCSYNFLDYKEELIKSLLHTKVLYILNSIVTGIFEQKTLLLLNIFYCHKIKCSHPFNNGVTITLKVIMANLLSENRIIYHNNIFDLKLYNFLFYEFKTRIKTLCDDIYKNSELCDKSAEDCEDLIEKSLYNIYQTIQRLRKSIRNKSKIENDCGECLNLDSFNFLLDFDTLKNKLLSIDIKKFYNEIEKIILTYSFNDDASINMLMNKYYKIEQQSSLSVKHSNVKNSNQSNAPSNLAFLNGSIIEKKNEHSLTNETDLSNNIQNMHINFTDKHYYKYFILKLNYDCLYRLVANSFIFGTKILKKDDTDESNMFDIIIYFFERYEILILQYLIKYFKRYNAFKKINYCKKSYVLTEKFLESFKVCYDIKKMSHSVLYLLDPYILNLIGFFIKNVKREPLKRRDNIIYFCCFEISFFKKKILGSLFLRFMITKIIKIHDLSFVYCYVVIDNLDNKSFLKILLTSFDMQVKNFVKLDVNEWKCNDDSDLLLYNLWNERAIYKIFFTTDVESLYNDVPTTDVQVILDSNLGYIKNLTYCVYMFTLKKLSPTVDTDIESYLWNITYLRVIKSIINNSTSILNFNYNNPLDSIVSVDGLNILANTKDGSVYNHMSNSARTAFNIPNYPSIANDMLM